MNEPKNNGKGNGNGSGEYNPEVELEYLDANVWIRRSGDEETVAYTEDVDEALKKAADEKSAD